MRHSILRDFGDQRPRAIVLDDNARARSMTGRRLRRIGFDVIECASASEFYSSWAPGTADVIIADWDLSNDPGESGDKILQQVRLRDWDVPFVLISGKLEDETDRANVLANLLGNGGAAFVGRG